MSKCFAIAIYEKELGCYTKWQLCKQIFRDSRLPPTYYFFLSHRNLFISTSNPMSVGRNLVLKVITSVCNSTFKTKNMKKTKEYWWDSIVSSGMIFQLKDILNVLWVIERNFSLFWGFFLSPVENIFVSVPGYNPIFRWLGFYYSKRYDYVHLGCCKVCKL